MMLVMIMWPIDPGHRFFIIFTSLNKNDIFVIVKFIHVFNFPLKDHRRVVACAKRI